MKDYNNKLKQLENSFEELFNLFTETKSALNPKERALSNFKSLQTYFDEKKSILKGFKDNKYYIGFIGPYSVGKSTFINALLKRDILPEKLEIATTAFPTYMLFEEDKEKEIAKIFYASKTERENIRDFYLEEIKKDITEEYFSILDSTAKEEELLESIEELENTLENEECSYNKKLITTLKNLLNLWNEKQGETDKISVDSIQEMVESNESSVIITKAEVYLNTPILSSNKDIVFVDLPGVDADNKRHYNITHDFTINEAKAHAYIIVTAPEKIDSQKMNEFLRQLGKHSKQVHKSFWVINRCDLISKDAIPQTILELKKKVNESSISVNEERLFTTSAINYKNKEKTEIDITLTESIDQLRETLSDYLSNTFITEFIETRANELKELQNRLLKFVTPKVGQHISLSNDEAKKLYEIEYIENKLDEIMSELNENFISVFTSISNKINNLDFFNNDVIKKLQDRLSNEFKELNTNESNQKNNIFDLEKFRDLDTTSIEDLFQKVRSNIQLNEYIRSEYITALNSEGEISTICKLPQTLLENKLKDFRSIHNQYKELISDWNLKLRLEGICDVLLIKYNDNFNSITDFISRNNINTKKLHILNKFGNRNHIIKYQHSPNYTPEITIQHFILNSRDLSQLDDVIKRHNVEEKAITIEDFRDYQVKVFLMKFYMYLDTIRKNANEYIIQCLKNHFKEMYQNIKTLIESKEFEIQLRFNLSLELDKDASKRDKINDERLKYIEIYNTLKTVNE